MSFRQLCNRSSGYLFYAGSLLYKGQLIPVPLVSTIFKILALVLYLIGCICWGIAFRPTHISFLNQTSWIATEHILHFCAAMVGLTASVLCMLSLLNPTFLLVGLWVFVVSDTLWCFAEHNRLQTHGHPNPLAQEATFWYAVCITLIALTSAITACFPPTFLVLSASAAVCVGIGLIAFYFYLQSSESDNMQNFGESDPIVNQNLDEFDDPNHGLQKKIEATKNIETSAKYSYQPIFHAPITHIQPLPNNQPQSRLDP